MNFFIKNFFSECDHIRSSLLIWSHLLKSFLMENVQLGNAHLDKSLKQKLIIV